MAWLFVGPDTLSGTTDLEYSSIIFACYLVNQSIQIPKDCSVQQPSMYDLASANPAISAQVSNLLRRAMVSVPSFSRSVLFLVQLASVDFTTRGYFVTSDCRHTKTTFFLLVWIPHTKLTFSQWLFSCPGQLNR